MIKCITMRRYIKFHSKHYGRPLELSFLSIENFKDRIQKIKNSNEFIITGIYNEKIYQTF